MPFTGVSAMDRKLEFVRLARVEGANRRELCRRFGWPCPRRVTAACSTWA